jgi:hypothetical protein
MIQNLWDEFFSSENKVGESFSLNYPRTISPVNYDRNWVWGSVSAVPWCYFSRCWLRLSCIFVWWHGHNLTTRNRGTSKVGSVDSKEPSCSTKVPSDLFLRCGSCSKKLLDAKENDSRPCRTHILLIARWISCCVVRLYTASGYYLYHGIMHPISSMHIKYHAAATKGQWMLYTVHV